MALTFLIGGARSGKSGLAVEICERHPGAVTYLATAPRLDADMDRRIDRHRAERPGDWRTIEEQFELVEAVEAAGDDALIIDCLTLWVSNLLARETPAEQVETLARDAARAAAARRPPTIAISNEVGLGVHPATELGREYRDLLGRVNQSWADAAETTLFLVAGRAVALGDPWTLLQDASADLASPSPGTPR